MFPHYRRAFLCSNFYPIIQIRTTLLQTLIPSFSILLLQHFSSSSSKYHHSFTVNYLINYCGIYPETASKLSNRVHFENSSKPDSVLAFFKTYGFSHAQLSSLIRKCPKLLAFDLNKTILPKLNFLLSKGASTSDIVQIVTQSPRILYQSLDNSMIPCYDFLKSFLLSDELFLTCIKKCAAIIYCKNPVQNIQLLLENEVLNSRIAFTLRNWPYIFTEKPDMFKKAMEEVKEMGFDSSKTLFILALRAKIVGKASWDRKIDLYKKWGWSEDNIVSAFLKYPWCMLASMDKIETMMQFFVNQLGWESLVIANHPVLIMLSLEKRVIPRAFVLQFLLSRGLIKDAKSATPYKVSEELFLKKFVNCFEKKASQLLKLYEEKKRLPSKVVEISSFN